MRTLYIPIVILLTAGIVGFLWYGQTDSATQTFGTPSVEVASTTPDIAQQDVIIDVPQPGAASAQATESTEQPTPEQTPPTVVCQSVRIVAGPASYEPCVDGQVSVLSAMQLAAERHGLVFTGREYPSLGLYIESINGKKGEDGYYWFLYINEVSSTQGASSALVGPGDVIEWRYKLGY